MPIPTHQWKNFLIDFVTELSISINWKGDNYNFILVIINRLVKMIYYKPVKVTIDTQRLAKVILNIIVWYHVLPNFILIDRGLLFTLKFWLLFCYFFGIKQNLFTLFHPQTNGQKERQNNTMETYFQLFINFNFKQNDEAKFLPIVEFAYNNKKNTSTYHTLFELNCKYHL